MQAQASSGDISAVNAAADALDKAFAERDVGRIKALMTADHVTVTPYYDGPQSVQDQIDSLGELSYGETIRGKVDVAVLAPDVALRTFVADLKGSFKGKTLPAPAFITELMVKRDGKWVERFFQITSL
jgi:ketosteroid isomerase-like protein